MRTATKTHTKFPKLEAKSLTDWFEAKRELNTYFKDHNITDPRQKIKKILNSAEDDVKLALKSLLSARYGKFEEWEKALDSKEDVAPYSKARWQANILDLLMLDLDRKVDLSSADEKLSLIHI